MLGYTTISPEGRRTQQGAWIEGVKVLNLTDTANVGTIVGRFCRYVSLNENETYLLGAFIRDEDLKDTTISLEDGEQLLWAGEHRIFYTGPNGDIGIYTAKRKDDGTIDKDPVFEYKKETETISMHVNNLNVSMLGAGTRGNLLMEQDSEGNFAYIFEGKTRLNDKNARFRLRISNPILPTNTENVQIASPDGLLELMVDTAFSGVSGSTPLEDSINPVSIKMGVQKGGLKGISINYGEMCEMMMGLNVIDSSHLFSLKTSNGAKISADSYGNITAEAQQGNKIKLSVNGNITVTSNAGVAINIQNNGKMTISSVSEVKVVSPKIELNGEVKLNTLPDQPGFCKQILCPMTGAPLTTNKAGN